MLVFSGGLGQIYEIQSCIKIQLDEFFLFEMKKISGMAVYRPSKLFLTT